MGLAIILFDGNYYFIYEISGNLVDRLFKREEKINGEANKR